MRIQIVKIVYQTIQDLGICIDSVSSSTCKSEPNLQTFTVEYTLDTLEEKNEEIVTKLRTIAKGEIFLQVINNIL